MRVREVMTTPVVTVPPAATVGEAIAVRMLEHRLRSVPVLERGRVVGVITWQDLMRAHVIDTAQGTAP